MGMSVQCEIGGLSSCRPPSHEPGRPSSILSQFRVSLTSRSISHELTPGRNQRSPRYIFPNILKVAHDILSSRAAPNGYVARESCSIQAIIGKEARGLHGTSFQSILNNSSFLIGVTCRISQKLWRLSSLTVPTRSAGPCFSAIVYQWVIHWVARGVRLLPHGRPAKFEVQSHTALCLEGWAFGMGSQLVSGKRTASTSTSSRSWYRRGTWAYAAVFCRASGSDLTPLPPSSFFFKLFWSLRLSFTVSVDDAARTTKVAGARKTIESGRPTKVAGGDLSLRRGPTVLSFRLVLDVRMQSVR